MAGEVSGRRGEVHGAFADLSGDREAVHIRKSQVDEHHICAEFLEVFEAVLTATCLGDRITFLLKRQGEDGPDVVVVLDEEDLSGHRYPPFRNAMGTVNINTEAHGSHAGSRPMRRCAVTLQNYSEIHRRP